MIDVQNLTRSYGIHRGVSDLNFKIDSGQIIGLLGPNGAGKSTTIRVLCTQLLPTSGSVKICGKDVVNEALEVRKLIGYLPENAPLYKGMITKEYLQFVASLHGLLGSKAKEAIERVTQDCDLKDILSRPLNQVSRGYRQRTGLAAALIHEPQLLILDEPTSSLDPRQVSDVHKLIRELSKKITVIFSSHILSEVEQLCERVLILNQGQLIADSDPQTLREDDHILLEVAAPAEQVKSKLSGFNKIRTLENSDNFCRLIIEGDRRAEQCQKVAKCLAEASLYPTRLQPGENTLEEVFAKLTKETDEAQEKIKEIKQEEAIE